MRKGLFIIVIIATLLAAGLLLPGFGVADTFTPTLIADATVMSGDNANRNYGAVASLLPTKAMTGATLNYQRQAYLKFQLPVGLVGTNPADVASVTLYLYRDGGTLPPVPGTLEAYHSPDIYAPSSDLSGSWVEGTGSGHDNADLIADGNPLTVPGITWNNKPSLSGALKMGTLPDPPDPSRPNYQYYAIDLLAGPDDSWLIGDLIDGYLSVALVIPSVTESTSFYFCSDESNPAACPGPSLVIETRPAPTWVPEPVSILLLGFGILGLAGMKRFKIS